MSWQTHRRRREVLLAVLRHARRDPGGPLPFECVPHATELFADRDELLLALHHRWMMLLTARLELATVDEAAGRVSAVSAAWRELAADEPELRAILDSPAADDVLRRAVRGEHRMLALWSGLAEPHEPADEVAAIGAALLRTAAPKVHAWRSGRLRTSPTRAGGPF